MSETSGEGSHTKNSLRNHNDQKSSNVSQNSILRMSEEKTLELVELYELEECLWNTKSPDYKRREKRTEAAEKIAKALDIPNFEARHVIIKFKNLRNSYCQELKKIAHSLTNGLGDEEIYRPKVLWFPKMDSFLRPHLQATATPNLFPTEFRSQDGGIDPELLCQKEGDIKPKSEPDYDNAEQECWVQYTDPEGVLPLDSDHECEPPRKVQRRDDRSRKRQRADSKDDFKIAVIENLRVVAEQLRIQNEETDHFDVFGKYIASLMRRLPERVAISIQPQIIALIATVGWPTDGETSRVSQSDENH